MYIFNLGFNQKWVKKLLITYYIVTFIIMAALSNIDSLRIITSYTVAVLIPFIIAGALRLKKNYQDKKWILINLIYPLATCIAFAVISINLSNTNYYEQGMMRAYSELKINEEEYKLKVDNYNEVKRSYAERESELLQTQSNNGDINKLYSDLKKRFDSYKISYPDNLISKYEELVAENNGYVNEIASLENKIEYNRQLAEQRKAAQAAATSQTSNNSNSSSSNSNSSSGSSSSSSKTTVYIASGNSYYHKTSSCKFIKGLSVQSVYLEDYPGKGKCNCWHY